MKLLLPLFLLFHLPLLYAQSIFERVYGGVNAESFHSAIYTSDGNLLVSGTTQSFGSGTTNSPDFYVVKMTMKGDTIWTRAFGSSQPDYAQKICETSDHYYVIAGYGINPANNSNDFYVVKTDTNGNKIWDYYYGGNAFEFLNDVLPLKNGNVLLCGYTNSFGNGGTDIYLIEIDSNGAILKEQFVGSTGNEAGNHIEQTEDGGFVITGYTNSNTSGYNVYLLKTDSLLNLEWSRNFGSAGNDYGYSVKQNTFGNFMILGEWSTSPDSGNIGLIRTDSLGLNPIIKFPGRHAGDRGFSLNKTNDNGFIISGYTQIPGKGSEMLLIKTNANGDTLWSKHFGGTRDEAAFDALQMPDNGYLIAGETEGFGVDNFDGYIVKTDSSCNTPCPTAVSFSASVDSICEDENVFFTNTTVSSQYFSWYLNGNLFSNQPDAGEYFDQPGTNTISLSACAASSSRLIRVHAKPETNFDYHSVNDSVYFTLNPVVLPKDISWNFGDGSPEDTIHENPVHRYNHQGMYWIILSVIDSNGCDSTFKKQIDVVTGLNSPNAPEPLFLIYPNPSRESVTLLFKDLMDFPIKITVQNISGATVMESILRKNETELNIESFAEGTYLVCGTSWNGKKFWQKFLVQ